MQPAQMTNSEERSSVVGTLAGWLGVRAPDGGTEERGVLDPDANVDADPTETTAGGVSFDRGDDGIIPLIETGLRL